MSSVTEVGPAAGADVAPRSRRALRILLGAALGLVAVLLIAAGALYAWDASYEGRILPGVSVGTTDVSGMDAPQAEAALTAAYPYHLGRLVLRTPDADVAIAYADIHRHADIDSLIERAMAAGRSGGVAERAIGELRLALTGESFDPMVVLDEAALTTAIAEAAAPLDEAPVDATITTTQTGDFSITGSRPGRTIDTLPITTTALAALRRTDAPAEFVIPVEPTVIPPDIDDADVLAAQTAGVAMTRSLGVTYRDRTWTIRSKRIRSWVSFQPLPDGTIVPVIDATRVPAAISRSIAKAVKQPPKSAEYLVSKSGRIVGVVASSTGRKLDVPATTRAIVLALNGRAAGHPAARVKVRTTVLLPKLATDKAARKAPVMSLLGSWRTWFPISERNFNGANIWVPAKLINGTVLQPGQSFDWWDAIWPVTTARGFGPGGVIRVDHTEPTGALGGGMCSSSTTLFNAAMRAGLDMGARSNHRYYITRYPLGLDATVAIIGGGRQSMTFRNDMKHPIFIRGIRTRSGGTGWVTYEIWGIPEGRRISVSKPSVSNIRQATTTEVPVDTLPKGERNQIEYPSNGMDVSVTRVVRNAGGSILHRDTWISHYTLWNGIIEVGQ